MRRAILAVLCAALLAACALAEEAAVPAPAAEHAAPAAVDGRAIIADIGQINTPNGIE